MARFSNNEKKLIEHITNGRLLSSLEKIREAMEDIWATDAPRIIHDYTDHGENHCERLAGFAANLLEANNGSGLSIQEIYLLLSCIYLHDIGMQCDVVRFPEIKNKAEQMGATFDVTFTADTSSNYSIKEQKAIRKNHHYLTAAWIDHAYRTNNTVLGPSARTIPEDIVYDMMDVCKHHAKLPIDNCPPYFKYDQNKRKRLLAAILRFSDELDIDSNRVSIETVKNFRLEPHNSLYWWLHNRTRVIFIDRNVIMLTIQLHPDDIRQYGQFIHNAFIMEFYTKNWTVLTELALNKIPIVISSNSNVVENEFIEPLPHEIIQVLKVLQDKEIAQKIIEVESRISSDRLFGRENDINKALNLLKERSFAITGIKGIGKSKLVSALFEKVIEDKNFPFQSYYWRRFTYDAPPSFSEFGRRLIKDLTNEDIDFGSKICEQVQLVIRTINEKQCLLVIDQFEAVIDRETRRPKEGFDELLTHANSGLEKARLVVTAWEVPKDAKGCQLAFILLSGIDEAAGMNLLEDLMGVDIHAG